MVNANNKNNKCIVTMNPIRSTCFVCIFWNVLSASIKLPSIQNCKTVKGYRTTAPLFIISGVKQCCTPHFLKNCGGVVKIVGGGGGVIVISQIKFSSLIMPCGDQFLTVQRENIDVSDACYSIHSCRNYIENNMV